jgi:DNA replication and repair protein RecF
VFSPDDLEVVKGDPSERRRFLDDLLVVQQPRFAGVRSDYDRVLKQRNTLLKTAGGRGGRRATAQPDQAALGTLDVWDAHLARVGAELLVARLALVSALEPHVAKAYAEVSASVPKPDGGNDVVLAYRSSAGLELQLPDRAELTEHLLAQITRRRDEELDRGVSLVGPHRDDLVLSLGELPARGYASHGEAWSLALALRLASFELLRADGDDPVLVLDDVFAELDALRRSRLAGLVAPSEQVLVTAAVEADVPSELLSHRFTVGDGRVSRVD